MNQNNYTTTNFHYFDLAPVEDDLVTYILTAQQQNGSVNIIGPRTFTGMEITTNL